MGAVAYSDGASEEYSPHKAHHADIIGPYHGNLQEITADNLQGDDNNESRD